VLTDVEAGGVRSVQVEPPFIVYGCQSPDMTWDEVAPTVAAAAVIGLPVNSGYPARLAPDMTERICRSDASRFASGEYEDGVAYVVANPVAELDCNPLYGRLVVCVTPATRREHT